MVEERDNNAEDLGSKRFFFLSFSRYSYTSFRRSFIFFNSSENSFRIFSKDSSKNFLKNLWESSSRVPPQYFPTFSSGCASKFLWRIYSDFFLLCWGFAKKSFLDSFRNSSKGSFKEPLKMQISFQKKNSKCPFRNSFKCPSKDSTRNSIKHLYMNFSMNSYGNSLENSLKIFVND